MANNGGKSGPSPAVRGKTATGKASIGKKTAGGASEKEAHARAKALSAKSRGKAGGGSTAPQGVRRPRVNDGTSADD